MQVLFVCLFDWAFFYIAFIMFPPISDVLLVQGNEGQLYFVCGVETGDL